MATKSSLTSGDEPWAGNYFNYFTEIEEKFRVARGTGLFLLSPLDWALIENWKDSGIPLEAVLRGIDVAFEKWRSQRKRRQAVNSLAYCAQAVQTEADILAGAAPASTSSSPPPPFSSNQLREYLLSNSHHLNSFDDENLQKISRALTDLASESEHHLLHLEDLERTLTALEEQMIAGIRARQSVEDLVAVRAEFDSQLRPYRSKMTGPQIAELERQFLSRRLLESAGLRRLSLFYLGT